MVWNQSGKCVFGYWDLTDLSVSSPAGGYSHTLPIRVCEAPDLERGIHFKGVF